MAYKINKISEVEIQYAYILFHLILDVLVETSLFICCYLLLRHEFTFIFLNSLEMLAHHMFIEIFLRGNLVFMAFECLAPGLLFRRVVVLKHTMIKTWSNIATVVEGLDCTCHHSGVPDEAVFTHIDLSFHCGSH